MQTVARVVLSRHRRHARRAARAAARARERACRRVTSDARASRAASPPSRCSRCRAPRSRRVQRPRRLHRATAASTSISTHARARTPAPWVNVLANPYFGTVVSRERRRVHVVRERARVPADAVEQRSGQRCRAARRSTSATRRPARSGRRRRCRRRGRDAVHRRATASATACSSTHEDGIRTELHRVRRDRRAGQVRRAASCATLGPRAQAVGHRLLSSWCSATCAPKTLHARRHRGRREDRRAVRAQRLQHRVRDRVAFLDVQRARRARHRRSHRVPRPQRHAGRAGGDARDAAVGPRRRRRSIPAPRCRSPIELADGQEREVVFMLGVGRDADDARKLVQRFRGARRAHAALEGVWELLEPRRSARSTCETPDPSLNFLPTAGCSIRCSPAGCGGAAASTSRAARSASATSCRTRWRWCTREPELLREHCCAARAPVPRRRRPALVASAGRPRRAHAFLRRLPVAAVRDVPLRRRDRRHRRARRARAVPRGPARRSRTRKRYYDLPQRLARVGDALRALRARDRARPALRRARPAADGQRRLERRHEPRRRRRARAKASGSAFFLYDVLRAVRRARAPRAATRRSPSDATIEARRASQRTSRSTAGTATGIAAPTSTTARRSARRRNARMPDRFASAELGRAVRRRRDRSASRRRMDAVDERLVDRERRADPAVRSAVRHVDAATPATSRATCPACARTAASTRTRRCGR